MLIAALMLGILFTACSEKADDDTATRPQAAAEAPITEEEGRDATKDSLPEGLDFSGEAVRIFYRLGVDRDLEIIGADDGDVLNSAVYRRNQIVEDRLNVKFEYYFSASSDSTEVNKEVAQFILAGDDEYDYVVNTMWVALLQATQDYYTNLIDAPYLDYSKPWWQGKAMENLQIGSDKRFFLSGEFLLSNIWQIGAVYFNKDLYESGFGDSDDLYQLVADGGWNFDKMGELSENVYNDVNGDGKKDDNDIFGFYADCGSSVDHFTFASDITYSKRDANGLPELDIYKERLVTLAEKIYDLFYNNAGAHVEQTADENVRNSKFAQGYSLFLPFRLLAGMRAELRDMKSDYGIIPYPKLDEAQKEYSTLIHNASSIAFLPVTCQKTDMVCAVLEALGSESYRNVTEEYYNTVLKVKYARDDISSQMIDIMYDSARKDFVYNFASSLGDAGYITRDVIWNGSSDVTSYYAKNESKYRGSLAKLLSFYTGQ